MRIMLTTMLALLAGVLPTQAVGQHQPHSASISDVAVSPLEVGHVLRFSSQVFDERREVRVVLPPSYGEGTADYPVIYTLDGASYLLPTAGAARYLSAYGDIPEVIVVGVHSTDRSYEMTPPPAPGFRGAQPGGRYGGADDLLRLFEDELIPLIDGRYRTQPFRVIVGHSLGGLLAAHAIVANPDLFQGHVLLDPSVWWNDRALVDHVLEVMAGPHGATARVASAQAAYGFDEDWQRLTATAANGFHGEHFVIEGESHASMAYAGTFLALRSIFFDFPFPGPALGQSAAGALVEHYEMLSRRVGYEVPPSRSDVADAVQGSIRQNRVDDAQAAVDLLVRVHGRSELSQRLQDQVDEARADSDFVFIPLDLESPRPTADEIAPFLGHWKGTIVNDPGVDFDVDLTIRQDGDSTVVESFNTGPRGHEFGRGPRVLVGVRGDGVLEYGRVVGGFALEVTMLRLEGEKVLIGAAELRGMRLPKSSPRLTQRVTLRLERVADEMEP